MGLKNSVDLWTADCNCASTIGGLIIHSTKEWFLKILTVILCFILEKKVFDRIWFYVYFIFNDFFLRKLHHDFFCLSTVCGDGCLFMVCAFCTRNAACWTVILGASSYSLIHKTWIFSATASSPGKSFHHLFLLSIISLYGIRFILVDHSETTLSFWASWKLCDPDPTFNNLNFSNSIKESKLPKLRDLYISYLRIFISLLTISPYRRRDRM